ncbi:hypothetical protein CQW23_14623 [Capsicum baccatum]|uniref:Ubiquitin-like protease family profile domain-containing protein n=1 Tax=Capsicum baccatum TaxID=33114 RepID=A0A2G2WJP2_CAPBA|nr:hypothetical protein CQW23_14623 [Capsicum baccatum]
MPFFLTLRSVQTLSDPKVVDGIKIELFGATTITRKIILEGGLVVVDDGSGSSSGSGAAAGANDAPLIVFETTSHYDYDHTGCTYFLQILPHLANVLHANVKTARYCQQQPKVFQNKECLINIIKGFIIPAGLSWHLVDEVYIPINCGDKFHWVLAVVILKERASKFMIDVAKETFWAII